MNNKDETEQAVSLLRSFLHDRLDEGIAPYTSVRIPATEFHAWLSSNGCSPIRAVKVLRSAGVLSKPFVGRLGRGPDPMTLQRCYIYSKLSTEEGGII